MHPAHRRRRRTARRLWTAALAALALPPHHAGYRFDSRPGGRTPVQRGLPDQRLGLRLHRRTDAHQPRHRPHRRLDPDVRLRGQPAADQRLERQLEPVREDRHRQERHVQRAGRGRRRRHHRRAVHLQRHQHRADELRRQRHHLRRRAPAADHGADQPGAGVGLLAGRGRPAGRHGRRGRQRHHQQGGVLRRHHAAGHRHQRALHALGLWLDRGQSFTGGEGLRQHGRLRRLRAGRHHGRLGTDRGRHAGPTGRPAGRVGELRGQAVEAADRERHRDDGPRERQLRSVGLRRGEPHLHPVELEHRAAG